MTADYEYDWMMREAHRAIESVRRSASSNDLIVTVQRAQACVEYCARAVVATYEEPGWGHIHGRKLDQTLLRFGSEIRSRFGRETLAALRRLAADDVEMGPWHVYVMYGKRDADQTFHPPSEICTEAVAERSVMLAERSFATAERFLQAWRAAREPS